MPRTGARPKGPKHRRSEDGKPAVPTRDTVLETAGKVLKERGLLGFNARAVALAGPYADGTVHKLVGGTSAILDRLLERELRALGEARSFPSVVGEEPAIIACFMSALRVYRADPQLSLILDGLQTSDPSRRGVRAELLERLAGIYGLDSCESQPRLAILAGMIFELAHWGARNNQEVQFMEGEFRRHLHLWNKG